MHCFRIVHTAHEEVGDFLALLLADWMESMTDGLYDTQELVLERR